MATTTTETYDPRVQAHFIDPSEDSEEGLYSFQGNEPGQDLDYEPGLEFDDTELAKAAIGLNRANAAGTPLSNTTAHQLQNSSNHSSHHLNNHVYLCSSSSHGADPHSAVGTTRSNFDRSLPPGSSLLMSSTLLRIICQLSGHSESRAASFYPSTRQFRVSLDFLVEQNSCNLIPPIVWQCGDYLQVSDCCLDTEDIFRRSAVVPLVKDVQSKAN
ncbi:Rho GTPase-activating protein 1 [Tyrophagus putrescentiae]|nr:Rho GTPase-activating protein 1 [Tyrophagus putrescentiae]